jgi:hypothetical protein
VYKLALFPRPLGGEITVQMPRFGFRSFIKSKPLTITLRKLVAMPLYITFDINNTNNLANDRDEKNQAKCE